jgi:acetyltransferase
MASLDLGSMAGALYLPRLGPLELRRLTPFDCKLVTAFVRRIEREDLRLRFAGILKLDEDVVCSRLLTIDPVRDTVVGALSPDGELLGEARLVRLDADTADFALLVRSDLQRQGLGRALLSWLIEEARRIGVTRLRGDVLYENQGMRLLARRLGFHVAGGSSELLRIEQRLASAPPLRQRGEQPFDDVGRQLVNGLGQAVGEQGRRRIEPGGIDHHAWMG